MKSDSRYVYFSSFSVDGFIFLILGTALYNGLFDCTFLPCFRDDDNTPEPAASHNQGDSVAYDDEAESERAPLLKDNKPTIA